MKMNSKLKTRNWFLFALASHKSTPVRSWDWLDSWWPLVLLEDSVCLDSRSSSHSKDPKKRKKSSRQNSFHVNAHPPPSVIGNPMTSALDCLVEVVVKWLRICLSIERSDVRGPPWSMYIAWGWGNITQSRKITEKMNMDILTRGTTVTLRYELICSYVGPFPCGEIVLFLINFVKIE